MATFQGIYVREVTLFLRYGPDVRLNLPVILVKSDSSRTREPWTVTMNCYCPRLMCTGVDAFRPLWARRRLNLSEIRLRSEKQRPEAEEKPPLAQ